MNRNKPITTLGLWLCTATLTLLGSACTRDADPAADIIDDGARTLNINIGPKQGFLDADAAPGTRSTVDESTGAMDWEEGDRIFVTVAYNDAANTWNRYTLVRTAAGTWDIYERYLTTYDEVGDVIDLDARTPISAIEMPLGATEISGVRANYTDSPTQYVADEQGDFKEITILDGGSRDYLSVYVRTPSIDAPIALNLIRDGLTRLHFPGGLTPGKKYYVDGFGSTKLFNDRGMSGSGLKFPFTAAADGSLALVAGIEGNKTVTLKEVDDDGDDSNDKVVYTASFNAASGSTYRCIIPASGGVDPGSRPDLLKPAPIVTGNAVWEVNGYWVTAPDADINKKYQWSTNTNATVMDNDPCDGYGNWRMPTMYDFQDMAGWTTSHSWSPSLDTQDITDVSSDLSAWNAAFPSQGFYWSSVVRRTNAWRISVTATKTAYYSWFSKSEPCNIRCVQKQ